MRASTSRPSWSLPNGWPSVGVARRAARSCRVASSHGTASGPKTATSTRSAMMARPTSERRDISRLLHLDARVEPAIEQVRGRVHQDVGDRDHEDTALRQRVVSLVDRVEQELSDAGPAEDELGDDGAGEQDAELKAEDRHD